MVSNVVWKTNPYIGPLYVRTSGCVLLVELEDLCLLLVEVLAGVGSFVLQELDEAVEADGEKGTENGTKPVYPVVAWESAEGDARAEGTGWVQRAL